MAWAALWGACANAPREDEGAGTDGGPREARDATAPAPDATRASDGGAPDAGAGRPDGGGGTRCEDLPFRSLPLCEKNSGVCMGSRWHCEDGRAVPCEPADYAAYHAGYADPETGDDCDGLDNDCDGDTDETCTCAPGAIQPCGTDLGACVSGTQRCEANAWTPCEGATGPVDEACNGDDDDCDGTADEDAEGDAPPCAEQAGVCAGSKQRCGGVGGYLRCDAGRLNQHDARYTPNEGADHCDGLDNDCDGGIDEACECRPGETRACGDDVGECRPGRQVCEGGRFTRCDGRGPVEETCSGADEDCDGRTDEGDLCAADEACRGGRCELVAYRVEAESGAMGHGLGREERGGWCAATGPDDDGVMVYGPYVDTLPAGTYDIVWRMLVDNNAADDSVVVRLEVNDFDERAPDCGDCVIAETTVRRRRFAAPMQWQDFPLRVANPGGGHRLEFRVYWTDIAYVCVDRIEARRVD